MARKNIYLDYNSTSPVDKRVLNAMLPYFTEYFGNAASKTHRYGWLAEEAVDQARKEVAALINCHQQEIIFTSGSTESLNFALKGVAENYKTKGNHIITVSTEHMAVLDTCKRLEKTGAQISYLHVDKNGMIDLQKLSEAITPKTILVCVMYANNETGVIHPVKKIAEIIHKKNSIFLCDGTQAVGKIPVDVKEDGIDLLCMSAHKMYGPKGVGALYINRKNPRVIPAPLIDGGGHERGFRSGTLNVPGIVGMGKACDLARHEMQDDAKRIARLRDTLEQRLLAMNNTYVNGTTKKRLPNTSNLAFEGIKADKLISKVPSLALAMGSACTSAKPTASHVLKAMGKSESIIYSSVRFSLGKYLTQDDIDEAAGLIEDAINDLKIA